VPGIVEQQAGQEMVGFGFGVISVGPLVGELLLNSIKKLPIHDRRLLTGQDLDDVTNCTKNSGHSFTAERPLDVTWIVFLASLTAHFFGLIGRYFYI
jgi:hypothetical protein